MGKDESETQQMFLSLREGRDGEVIPSIVEKMVKSLGRWCNSVSSDRGQAAELRE